MKHLAHLDAVVDQLGARRVDVVHRQEQAVDRPGSDPVIGARLFLSPRTVGWHLRTVFAKLGIRSRRELSAALSAAGSELAPASA